LYKLNVHSTVSHVITDFQLNRKGLTQSAAISYSACRSLAMLQYAMYACYRWTNIVQRPSAF